VLRALLLAPPLLLPSSAGCQEAPLDVSGRVLATEPRLEVRVTLTNRSGAAAGSIEVSGELFGEQREAFVPGVLAHGAEGSVTLDFPPAAPRPGLHALTLLLEYPIEGPPDAAGNPPMASERAFLLLALGAHPGEAVRLEAEPLTLEVRGKLRVRIESPDGEPQRVRLRALTARGLRPGGEAVEVAVPARGAAEVELPLIRAGLARGRRQALLLVAENLDGPLARTSVAAVSVELLADPARLPRLRVALAACGAALLLVALGYELWERFRPHAPPTA
jgi:hypothetical protein